MKKLDKIKEHILKINFPKDIFELFKLLNYPKESIFDISYKRKKSSFDFKKEDEQRINEIYAILNFDEKLPVFLIEATTLTPSFVRSVTATFDKQYLQFLLIFTTDYSEITFVFPNREKIEIGKHKLKLTKLLLNKAEIHYTEIQAISNIYYEGEDNWRDILKKWKKAFSVERVTEDFFEDYKNIFFSLRKRLIAQKVSNREAHEFTLQFLNRIMFIYFIQKKSWLGNTKFMEWLWISYKKLNKYKSDEFYDLWLKPIFFKAFNNRSQEIDKLPKEIIEVVRNAPYLNGGLFRKNNLDNLKMEINDTLLQEVFEFFNKYNFTIKEDMPLDQEVAVDPQMIGYVYESLACVAEEIYDRTDFGIFYTPKVEVDFMCRKSLVEYLSKHLPEIPKEKFYHLIFDLPEEKEKIEKYLDKDDYWHKLKYALDNLSIVDPACGSGAFLVGMLNILTEIYKMVYKHLKRNISDFEMKKRIIQYSLYGVDVMAWAIHAAELRLWLQLIVETDFKKEELRKHPLLPNLDINLRIGDSLVQEIGGLTFNLRTNKGIKPHLRKELDGLKQEKRKYLDNAPTAEFKNAEEIKDEEIRLFDNIIDERIECLETDIEVYTAEIGEQKDEQNGLFGKVNKERYKPKKVAKIPYKDKNTLELEIRKNKEEIEKLKKVKQLLKDPEKKPFVWDIDFAEIFGDKNGFDIVIGNPPYVRQEKICPPNIPKKDISDEQKREYKEKLINSVKNHFPVITELSRKSDLYIYFYFQGLGLLNEQGTFCFITSNSWLDVEYGKELQEFLLRYSQIIGIYDNPKRSFSHADVNTIIALFGAPTFKEKTIGNLRVHGDKANSMLDYPAKFIMFKKPFEEVLSTNNLLKIEDIKIKEMGKNITEFVKNVVNTNDFRVFPILQKDLLEDSWEYPEDYNKKQGRFKAGSYEGNKWGSKLLRAPDIFYTILEKGKFKPLKEFGKIETYLNTGGADKFYFVDVIKKDKTFAKIKNTEFNEEFVIENRFLQPLIKSSQELSKILIEEKDVQSNLILIDEKEKVSNLKINDYIQFGVKKKYNQRSGPSGRAPWWKLPEQARKCYKILFPRNYSDKIAVFYNPQKFIANRFYRFESENPENFILLLNSTLNLFMMELFGRRNLGLGALDLEKPDLRNLPILEMEIRLKNRNLLKREVGSIFEELGINPNKPIREQEPKPPSDRAELDKIIFDELGLTKEERKEVYWSICELVRQRIEKARSLNE